MIKKIIKIYFAMLIFMISFTKKDENYEYNLENKILENEIIKIKDIREYLKNNKEIKSYSFVIIFFMVYPIATPLLMLSSIITTIWCILYLIKIEIYKKNKRYDPIMLEQEIFKIHCDINIFRILKLLLFQLPKIKGFNNAYNISKFKGKEKNIISNCKIFLNNLKNIVIFSISPSRLVFITNLCIYILKNKKKDNYFSYYLKKYVYNEIYRNDSFCIEKVKKMKIFKKRKNIFFNPVNSSQKKLWNVSNNIRMIKVMSVNGPHWAMEEEEINENYSLYAQLTGTIVNTAKGDANFLTLYAKNYKKDRMHLITNLVSEKKHCREEYNAKIFANMGLDSEDKAMYIKTSILAQRLENKKCLIQSKDKSIIKIDLENKNIYEQIANNMNPVKKEKIEDTVIIKRAEKILNWHEKLDPQYKKTLYTISKEKTVDLHTYERKNELDEIIKQSKSEGIFRDVI